MTAFRIVFGAAFVFFLCLSAGDLLFHGLKLKLPRRERIFLAFLTGASLVSTCMFFLASATLVYTKVVVSLGVMAMAAWAWICRPNFRNRDGLGPALPTIWRIVFWAPLLIYGVSYFFAAMLPVTDPDGTVYHVGLIARFYDHRGFFHVPNDMFAGLAEGIEMLFWIAFAFGRHSAASMVELLFLLAMPFGMLSFGERIKMPRAGVVAGLLFYMAPVAGKAGTIAYIDVATAAVVFGCFYLVQVWREEDDRALLVPAGLLAGFCFACKITASSMTVYAALFVLIFAARRKGWKAGLQLAGVVVAFACLTAAPWLIKNAIYYRNPFFPLFNRWFPNPYLYPSVEAELRQVFGHTNGVPYSQIFYNLAVGGKLFGIVGPIFLLAPLALLALRFRAGRQLLIAFLIAFAPYFANTGARFFLPALPFLAMALAIALVEIPIAGSAVGIAAVLFHAWISWPGEIDKFVPGFQWRIDTVDLRASLRIKSEAEYLNEHWGEYQAGLMLDHFVPASDTVMSLSMGQLAYQHRNLIGSFESTLARRAYSTLVSHHAEAWARGYLRDIRFAPMTASRIRLRVGARFDNDPRICELRFFNGDTEIVRSPGWRLTASKNPWEVQLAFDNDPWSWWTSGDTADAETWIEAQFPSAVRLDRVTIRQVEDQRWIQLVPEILVNGNWVKPEVHETDTVIPAPADLKMQLKDELKSMGVRWILVHDGDPEGDDLRANSPQWGVQQIAETGGFRLWKLL